MANALYSLAKQSFLGQSPSINMATDTIKVALVTVGYTANMATDQFLTAVGANTVGTAQQITSASVTNGVFNGANPTFTAVSGSQVTQLVIYKDTTVASTSPLIARFDTATGLPVTPNGGNITISWDTGANKIFAL